MTADEELWRALERCPECDSPMDRVQIDGIDSWECPKDGYAYDVEDSSDD